ncbi:MAG: hypothetical protein ACM3S1_01990 [Hyphomicrobiales bacterium]
MTCICGHPRSWHRVHELVRLVRRCHSWGCRCDRFIPFTDDDCEPAARFHRAFGAGRELLP